MKASTVCAVSSEIARTFRQLHHSTQDTKALFSAIRSIEGCKHFHAHKQQDCCELLMKVQDHWSETNRRIFNLFEGGTKYIVGCLECEDKRETFEAFTTLSLTLEDKDSYKDETASLAYLEQLLNSHEINRSKWISKHLH